MIGTLVLIFIHSIVASGDWCWIPPICQCYGDVRIVSCNAVDNFPSFNDSIKKWTIFLDIQNTSIQELPPLDDWGNIEMITLKGNAKLDCTTTPKNNISLYVDSDCITRIEEPVRGKSHLMWLYSLTVLPVILVGIAGSYRNILKMRQQGRISMDAVLKL